ncbi:hypothetical protein HPP92_020257 [Vanilla planifolia]|uniref:Clp R domain-containing protein n=2 Tax=Vanilla planifolia TaxID=51239 RepID=A0A835PWK6_VANPL|nr:hypothetical protein HPP92_020257 [Vanilla planifolia]
MSIQNYMQLQLFNPPGGYYNGIRSSGSSDGLEMAARVLTLLPTQVSLFASGSKKVASSSSSSTTLSFELVDRRRVTLSSSFLGEHISLHFCPLGLSRRRRFFLSAMVFSMFSTVDPDRFANEKTPNWSARAIKSFAMAEVEAKKLKYPNTGTECLLMGILVEGTSQAAKFLRQNGLTLIKVREYTVELLGKNDMHYSSPMHPPLTEPAQRALDCAIDEKNKSGEEGEVTTTHMLLGIWAQKDSAGHRILAYFGFNDDMAGELAKSASDDAVFSYR